MGAPAHQPRTLVARSCSLLSAKSDDSDFEFGPSESGRDEPPASPRLHRCSSPTCGSADISPLHLDYAAPPSVYGSHASPRQQQPADASCEEILIPASIKPSRSQDNYEDEDDDDAGLYNAAADGDGGASEMCSAEADSVGPLRKESLGSLMVQRREIDLSRPLANVRSATVPQRVAKVSKRRPALPTLASPSPLTQESFSPAHISFDTTKKSRRWSFRLDFLHPKRAAQDGRQSAGAAERMINAAKRDAAAAISEGNYDAPETPRQSTGSHSPAASPSRISPASPWRASAQSAAYHCPSPPHHIPRLNNTPMSPHAQHYQQQRARAQQLRKKTFLPYRQNFLGSCFFPSPSPISSC